MSWFSDIYGFEESTYARTQAKFCIDGPPASYQGPVIPYLSCRDTDYAESG
ncbi:Uncharacterised protein [Escherichia coli]|uniref:Uncharacterized protein n=1 Tax=Escherichia coli TaxID=562 RepID=A0A2X1LF47_ECOLX|nr:Uncharacterised protein [Escherichia coli]